MGGDKVISLGIPMLGEDEKKGLCGVIDSGWVTMGDRVAAFEKAFAGLHGVEEAVAVNSCTAGLHLILAALGVGPGDEVLVPSLTFVATSNAVLYTGATPVFVDIEDTMRPHISLAAARAACTAATRAVIVMHYGGYTVDLPAWRAFADERGLFLVEDAAHCPATGEVGRLSDGAAFSFFSNKNMTTAEGGMVLARDAGVLARVRAMRGHGMNTTTLDRQRGHAFTYDVTMLGHNYRLDELRAAMGLAQLVKLPQWNADRRRLSAYYRKLIADFLPDVVVPFRPDSETAAHLMPVILPEKVDRQKVMSGLRQAGIQSSIHYPPIHKFSYYQERYPGISLPETEEFCARELTLPLHPGLTEDDVERVVRELGRNCG